MLLTYSDQLKDFQKFARQFELFPWFVANQQKDDIIASCNYIVKWFVNNKIGIGQVNAIQYNITLMYIIWLQTQKQEVLCVCQENESILFEGRYEILVSQIPWQESYAGLTPLTVKWYNEKRLALQDKQDKTIFMFYREPLDVDGLITFTSQFKLGRNSKVFILLSGT